MFWLCKSGLAARAGEPRGAGLYQSAGTGPRGRGGGASQER
jgi:hypothetical protein